MHPKLTQTVNQLSVLRCSVMSESVTPWIVAHQAPLFMGFSRLEYWSGLPCPPPGDLPNPGTEPGSLMSPALSGRFFTTSATWDAQTKAYRDKKGLAKVTQAAGIHLNLSSAWWLRG